MKVEVLLSVLNAEGYGLIERMRICSDAVVINQCSKSGETAFSSGGGTVRWFDLPERGVGRSRNAALRASEGDIVLFVDDDVEYVDGYAEAVEEEFRLHPDADVIMFNVKSQNPERPEYQSDRFKRLRYWNSLRYGAFRMAARAEALKKNDIEFSLLFGGGARYGSGEDNIFVWDCLKKGLRVYASPRLIGYVYHGESTWFSSFNEKFFFDKGALYARLSGVFTLPLCLQHVLRHGEMFESISRPKALGLMLSGARDWRRNGKNGN